ncbi:MAG: [FeFe] hydrogenase H-cluster radical SAM maturase HydE [Alphaproteobacteria bacterium]|nr:[FeFe] hydrogenase H-cluster radical SAM maturase HydE [Alphaproteobacteria bacterium]
MMEISEIKPLLLGEDDTSLFAKARKIRDKIFDKEVYLRAIVEFSNVCNKDCAYCGLRASNGFVQRYRLSKEEIIESAAIIPEVEIGTIVLQSGDDPYYTKEMIGEIITEIKSKFDIAITLSLGEHDEDTFKYWRDCGADRYLLKIETFDKKLHETIKPHRTLKQRLEQIEILYKLGYEVGSGLIVGLPGMDINILAGDMQKLIAMDLHMVSISPFVPHKSTPFGGMSHGDIDQMFRANAIMRLAKPGANIPATSAISSLDADGKKRALMCGANVIMPSLTPKKVRELYNIYPGKNIVPDEVCGNIEATKQMIKDCGLTPSSSKGFSKVAPHP